ncbi:hypothetical protein BGW80DRAFT_1343800, partial [Lactifluus volemus]
MREGLDERHGVSKLKQAHEFRKAAKTTYRFAKTASDRGRDEAQFGHSSSSYAHFPSENVLDRVMSIAKSLYRCHLSCNDAFPPRQTRAEWARAVWSEACARVATNPLPLPQAELFKNSGMSLITDIKMKIMHSIESYYGFDTSLAPHSISFNASRAYILLTDMTFIYRDCSPDNRERHLPYRHPMIQRAINIIWFQNKDAVGIVFEDHFTPMPIPAIALALTAIECCIGEWSEGTRRMSDWDEGRYRTTYHSHIASLTEFGRHVSARGQLGQIQHDLLENARQHAGVIPGRVTGSGRFSQEALEAAHRYDNVPSYYAQPP